MGHSHPNLRELAQIHRSNQIAQARNWRLAQEISGISESSTPKPTRRLIPAQFVLKPVHLVRLILSLIGTK